MSSSNGCTKPKPTLGLVATTLFTLTFSPSFLQDAPGLVSTTADGWSVDTMKASFLGVMAHWIEVKDGKWTLHVEVIRFQGISGEHSGANLGWYFVGVCE